MISKAEQIQSFAHLPDGWHYGEGRGATPEALSAALEIDGLLINRVEEIEVFPAVDGGVMVSGYLDEHNLEVMCAPSGRMDLWHEENNTLVHEQRGISTRAFVSYLEGLEWTDFSHAYYTDVTLANGLVDSRALPFRSHPVEVSPHSTLDAPFGKAEASVDTPDSTTRALLEAPLSSGGYLLLIYQANVPSRLSLRAPETSAIGTFDNFQRASGGGWFESSRLTSC